MLDDEERAESYFAQAEEGCHSDEAESKEMVGGYELLEQLKRRAPERLSASDEYRRVVHGAKR